MQNIFKNKIKYTFKIGLILNEIAKLKIIFNFQYIKLKILFLLNFSFSQSDYIFAFCFHYSELIM